LVLKEIADGINGERDIVANMGFKPTISEDLKVMDEELFREERLNLYQRPPWQG